VAATLACVVDRCKCCLKTKSNLYIDTVFQELYVLTETASGSVPEIKLPMILGFSCVEWKSYNGSRFLRSLDKNCWWEALSGALRWKFSSLQEFLNIRDLILF
jgi:hypothetical protein